MQHVSGNLSNHHLPGGGRDPQVVEHRCGNCYNADLGKSKILCKNEPGRPVGSAGNGETPWEALLRKARKVAADENGMRGYR